MRDALLSAPHDRYSTSVSIYLTPESSPSVYASAMGLDKFALSYLLSAARIVEHSILQAPARHVQLELDHNIKQSDPTCTPTDLTYN
jgi:hypothetical protein